jgi:hypothetical protein
VFATLVFRARAICDEDILAHELGFLKTAFGEHGYSLKQIQRVVNRKEKIPKDNQKPTSTAFLPYVHSGSSQLNRMLKRRYI